MQLQMQLEGTGPDYKIQTAGSLQDLDVIHQALARAQQEVAERGHAASPAELGPGGTDADAERVVVLDPGRSAAAHAGNVLPALVELTDRSGLEGDHLVGVGDDEDPLDEPVTGICTLLAAMIIPDKPKEPPKPTVAEVPASDESDRGRAWDDVKACDLNRFRARYVEELLEEETGQTSSLHEQVLRSWKEHEFLSRNINLQFEMDLTFWERLSDRVAGFGIARNGMVEHPFQSPAQ